MKIVVSQVYIEVGVNFPFSHQWQIWIRGPSIFRKKKDVEYTLFLPYDVIIEAPNECRVAMEFILRGIIGILAAVHIDAKGLEAQQSYLIDHACSDPTMLKKPWPERRSSTAN